MGVGTPIIRAPQYIAEADYVVTESTYGDRLHNVKEKPNYAADLAPWGWGRSSGSGIPRCPQ